MICCRSGSSHPRRRARKARAARRAQIDAGSDRGARRRSVPTICPRASSRPGASRTLPGRTSQPRTLARSSVAPASTTRFSFSKGGRDLVGTSRAAACGGRAFGRGVLPLGLARFSADALARSVTGALCEWRRPPFRRVEVPTLERNNSRQKEPFEMRWPMRVSNAWTMLFPCRPVTKTDQSQRRNRVV